MKPVHALAILGVLAAGPAWAQAPVQAIEPQLMARIQQQLKQDGYYDGQVDGLFGQDTSRALAQWQDDQGIRATGQVDARTLAAMDGASGAPQQAETPESPR